MNARPHAMASIAALAVTFAMTGCLSRLAPPAQTYAFSAADVAPNTSPGSRVLGIRALSVAPPFDGRAFVYRIGATSFVRDPYAEFLDSPVDEIAVPVRAWLRRSGSFSAVAEPGSLVKPNTFAEVSVTELYGDFRKPGRAAAVLTIRFVFVDALDGIPGKIILAREYSRSEPLDERTASALMNSWNRELGDIFTELNRELSDNLLGTERDRNAPKK
jgi:hypothetical protein